MKPIALALVSLFCSVFAVACMSAEAKRAEAASSYAGQQAACIANKETRAEIDACRDAVKAAWSKDAGAEGGAK